MNAEALLAHYDQVAEGPDAITRLRKLVLDLAVRGKLLGNGYSASQESAQALLDQVEEITGRPANSAESAFPFDIPAHWQWSSIGRLSTKTGSGSTPRGGKEVYKSTGVMFLRSQNIHDDGLRLDDVVYVDIDTHKRMSGTAVADNDLLLNITGGSIGRCALLQQQEISANVSQHVAIIRMAVPAMARFAHLVIRSPYFQRHVVNEQTGAGRGGLPKNRMDQIVVPVPPVAEQHRIVAKVDELMALCDRLEAARAQREASRDRLTASTLARLNTPGPPASPDGDASEDSSFQSDARFALKVLPALTVRPDQIKQLRQTILNLAIQGKLVLQDARDQPASKLLQSISDEKAARKLRTKDARIKDEPDPSPAALPVELPSGWAAQSFENLFLFIDYRGNTPTKTDAGIPLITAKNIRMGYLNREPREFIAEHTYAAWMTRGVPAIGDLFFTTEAPLANVCLNDIDGRFALAQRVICLQPYGAINTKFVMFALMGDVMQSLIDRHATGMTAKGIKAAKLKPLPVPVPPLAEQHRIVAKVDELMALCDQLEASLSRRDSTRSRLLNALLHEALSPQGRPLQEAA